MASRFDSIYRPDLFEGQVIFITGGGTGLGRCTAHELASLGATVVIGARRPEPLEQTAKEIQEAGGRCETVPVNVREEDAVEAAVETIVERHGRIDGLFNNAGGQFVSPTETLTANGWRTVIDLILTSTFLVSNAVFRRSMKEHGGAIVNMLADIWTGYPGMAHMSAARAGIENLSRSLALEWSPKGVRVNCIAPGAVLSAGLLVYPTPVQELTVEKCRGIAAARLGTESEVSAAVTFLLGPAAGYITGETINVDGGSRFQKERLMPVGGKPTKSFHGFHLPTDFSGTPYQKLLDEE